MAATAMMPQTQNVSDTIAQARQQWGKHSVQDRLHILKRARHLLASHADDLARAIPAGLQRTEADTLAAEVLPLLAACRFLEREAARLLKPRTLGRRGLPFWLSGVDSRVERVPLGTVLIIAPANYPLLLAGVQTLQALAAGNSVVWKPGRGGASVAELFAEILYRSGVPQVALRVTDDSVAAGIAELAAQPDKIVFTGSAASGRAVLHAAADRAIPVVAELSGCDAVIVLPSADATLVHDALLFGMRLNGSATCMAPRRLILVGTGHDALIARLRASFAAMPSISLDQNTHSRLRGLLADASASGASIAGDADSLPVLISDATPQIQIAQADIFAPVLTVLLARDVQEAVAIHEICPTGLTAAIFGDEPSARAIGKDLSVGTVLINDLIVPTADPRVPFGGRKASGFGTTRGAEGLLEMTAAKTIVVRRKNDRRHLAPTGDAHADLFRGAIAMSHGATLGKRFGGMRQLVAAAKRLGQQQTSQANRTKENV